MIKTKAKSFEGWFRRNFTKDEMRDMVEHGANVGFHSITYYSDTVSLYDRFVDDIWEMLWSDAEQYGQTILEFIASFNGAKDVGGDEQFKNLLVWYACEKLAYQITEV